MIDGLNTYKFNINLLTIFILYANTVYLIVIDLLSPHSME